MIGLAGSDSAPRILVADDDDFIRLFLWDFLTRQGYTVELVPNGAEVLEKAGRGGYSLILLDLEMGRPTGLEVIASLNAAGNETPMILMSGSFSAELQESAPYGVEVMYLAKPFSGAELDAAIEQAIGKSAG